MLLPAHIMAETVLDLEESLRTKKIVALALALRSKRSCPSLDLGLEDHWLGLGLCFDALAFSHLLLETSLEVTLKLC